VEKSGEKFGLLLRMIFNKQPEINKPPIGKILPNLVTLQTPQRWLQSEFHHERLKQDFVHV
jgi:hypothetical protein